MRRAAPDIVYSTMGQSGLVSLTLDKPYRWRQNPDWTPNHPQYRDDIVRPAGLPPMSAERQQRIKRFAALLDEEPKLTIEQAAEQFGVALRTAQVYERESRHLRRPAP